MVGPERLELSHIAALDPKSSASTNFATGPRFVLFNFSLSANRFNLHHSPTKFMRNLFLQFNLSITLRQVVLTSISKNLSQGKLYSISVKSLSKSVFILSSYFFIFDFVLETSGFSSSFLSSCLRFA